MYTKNIRHIGIFFLLTLLLLAACSSQTNDSNNNNAANNAADSAPEADIPTGVIILSDISDEPAKKIERFQPLADYLAANLHDYGIGVGEVEIAPDMDTMIQWMSDGTVDLYMDSVYPAMVISDASGAEPILRRWKKGVGEYHSVFFALAKSGINSLDDLVGQTIAFEDPNSTSGYMLPLGTLLEAGFTVNEVTSLNTTPDPDAINYIFSGEDQNTLQWVISEQVIAGVTDNNNYEELREETDAQLQTILETESVPRNVVLLNPEFDDDLQRTIIDLLIALEDTPEGQEILDIHKTSRFDTFPDGIDAAFARLRELYNLTNGG